MEISMDNNNGSGSPTSRQGSIISAEWVMQQHAQQQEVNAQLMQSLAAIRASLQTPNPPSTTGIPTPDPVRSAFASGRKPKHILSHPNKFDGRDRSAYPAFKGYLQVKFRIDSDAIGGDTEKVWYGYGFLTDKASERIFPWLAATEKRQQPLRVEDFFYQLDAAFDDPQKTQRALEWINSEKQGNRPFRDFLQDFEQKLLEAGGWEFSDGVQKGYLRAAVSKKIKGELVAVEEPARYKDFVNQLRRISDNLDELNRQGGKHSTWADQQNDQAYTDQSNGMD